MNKMANERDQVTRAEFCTSKSVGKHIKMHGIPKSKSAFRDMVASGTSEGLDSEKGLELVSCLRQVVFARHPQQLNIMDKSNGRIIAVIT